MFKLFAQGWKGETSLAKAFWLIYVLFGIIIALIITVPFALFAPDFMQSPAVQLHYSPIIRTIYLPYSIYAAICVWRCGVKANIFWKVLSRILVILSIALGLLQVVQLVINI